ncbi:putative integral membrane protein [Eutypa lata UCREL1]|uniref:Putative integral membrane protein n=1 Tax=Eutypa lata (strain UCR-EL1) TaxID=1287681 RepID=M7SH27_EUTLA|nr:putative integral membrane protein [Eutypa lata UCREL1]
MGDIPDIKKDLPMSMTMAAFSGISWYIGAEINTSLFMRFKRRRGLYFWSCALGSWGVILQPLFIILADFGVWHHLTGSITMIYLTWLIMVVPQSWVLYSRLHLIMHEEAALRWISSHYPQQATSTNPNLFHINTIWDRLQLIVFFVQETSLSILYIYQARKFLRDSSLLHRSYSSSSALTPTAPSPRPGGKNPDHNHNRTSDTNQVLYHLIYTNLLIIALDATLLGIQCADLFYLQGAFKPCVYGVKLKVEFVILNRLIKSLRSHSISGPGSGNNAYNMHAQNLAGGLIAVGGSGHAILGRGPVVVAVAAQEAREAKRREIRFG